MPPKCTAAKAVEVDGDAAKIPTFVSGPCERTKMEDGNDRERSRDSDAGWHGGRGVVPARRRQEAAGRDALAGHWRGASRAPRNGEAVGGRRLPGAPAQRVLSRGQIARVGISVQDGRRANDE